MQIVMNFFNMNETKLNEFDSLQLEQLIELFDREQITMEILAEMSHEDLKQVGVSAYGFRHKILKGIAAIRAQTGTHLSSITTKSF